MSVHMHIYNMVSSVPWHLKYNKIYVVVTNVLHIHLNVLETTTPSRLYRRTLLNVPRRLCDRVVPVCIVMIRKILAVSVLHFVADCTCILEETSHAQTGMNPSNYYFHSVLEL